ncbi:MAG: acylneuraminate cytidylyltransferase family protein [Myxococcota bacterium]
MLCVIPARGGSKGLPGKNIRPLAGVPLIGHSIRCARMCRSIDRTVISTDSEQIAGVARSEGGDVPFIRPAELATDTASMLNVLKHSLLETERIDGRRYESLLLLDPTSPGRWPVDVDEAAVKLEADPSADGVVGVSQPDFNPFWHCVVDSGGYMAPLIPGADKYTRRQDVPSVFRINASLYIWRRDYLLAATAWQNGRLLMHVVPEARSIHIDEIEEFERADLLVRNGLVKLPWLV